MSVSTGIEILDSKMLFMGKRYILIFKVKSATACETSALTITIALIHLKHSTKISSCLLHFHACLNEILLVKFIMKFCVTFLQFC